LEPSTFMSRAELVGQRFHYVSMNILYITSVIEMCVFVFSLVFHELSCLFHQGYQTGPYSTAMNETIHRCDQDLGYLLDQIDQNPKLQNNLHLIVTSDHGLEQVNATDVPIYLDDYVNMSKLKAFGTKTLVNIFVNSGMLIVFVRIRIRFIHTRESIDFEIH
jgi:hypothetical protein